MPSLRELFRRFRSHLWRVLGVTAPASAEEPTAWLVYGDRPILRDVSVHGVRVYSLCGCCGARLSASATLCDACARGRSPSAPNA